MALVVLGVVLLRSAPMYPALGVCVCCGGVRLYQFVVDHCFIYKSGVKAFFGYSNPDTSRGDSLNPS